MRNNADIERKNLQSYADIRGIKPTTWQNNAGLGDGTLTKFLNGTTQSISRTKLTQLANWYNKQYGTNLSGMDLVTRQAVIGNETHPTNHNIESGNLTLGLQVDPSLPLIPLWRSSPRSGEENETGGWVLSVADVGTAPRPETMRYSVLVNGFKVLDKKNEPVYCYKDTVIIDRDLPGEEGEDCAFLREPMPDRPGVVTLGKLVRETPEAWIISQYNGREPVEIPKSDCPNAWPIVARYHHR